MPKRIYPFEMNLQPQFKVHVGQKQVNNGVSKDERMKNIYDKTLTLLKAGIKTYSHKLNETAQMDFIELPSSRPSSACRSKSSNLKQMLLTDKLQLKASDKIINYYQMDLCDQCCRVIDLTIVHRCNYCDDVFCFSCLCACASCSELFCQKCSLPVYNSTEQTMCLNCYR